MFELLDEWQPLEKADKTKSVKVKITELSQELVKPFDYQIPERIEFQGYKIPESLSEYHIGLIVGASGTGKSTMLQEFGEIKKPKWSDKAIAEHFSNPAQAEQKLMAVGLASVPTWLKPYEVLSNGEKFRADLARNLESGACIDEFTSVIDRNVALSASKSLRRYALANDKKKIVVASVHRDIIPYLKPDWIIDLDAGKYVVEPKECLCQPELVAQIFEVEHGAWQHFAEHHYLTAELSPFARCFLAVINGQPAGFVGSISYPSGTVRHAFRESRLVVKPDFQGMGLGTKLSEFVARAYKKEGKRYFSKTSHPKLGEHRELSELWKPTSKNKKFRLDAESDLKKQKARNRFTDWVLDPNRFVYSHEYIGKSDD